MRVPLINQYKIRPCCIAGATSAIAIKRRSLWDLSLFARNSYKFSRSFLDLATSPIATGAAAFHDQNVCFGGQP